MNSNIIKEELRKLAGLINEQQQAILAYEGNVPKIEIDILLQNYRRAYELLTEISKPVSQPVQNPKEETSFPDPELIAFTEADLVSPVKNMEIPVEIEKAIDASEPVKESTPPVQPEIILAAVEMPVIPVENEIVTEAALPQAGIQKERSREFTKTSAKALTASLFDEAHTVAQQFSSSTTVRDRYNESADDNSIAEKLQQDPLSDLKKSIGINEKFAFVNELFDGDLGNYNIAIDLLNNCTDLNTAIDILSGKLAPQYQWSDEGTSFRQLKNLVTRRFSA